jgi:hypothetical protein
LIPSVIPLALEYLHESFKPQFWSPGADPTKPWTLGPLLEHNQQQGGAIADFDGDRDNDILAGYRWWYRNAKGDGTACETVEIFASGFDDCPLTCQGDFDHDGDIDFALVLAIGWPRRFVATLRRERARDLPAVPHAAGADGVGQ